MKTLRHLLFPLSLFMLCHAAVCQAAEPALVNAQNKALKIAVVNFKTCVEKSKLGQKEQAAFDAMKKQMETVLLEKEKALNDVASKFQDVDYLDSLSHEAEVALKDKFRTLNAEFNQQQNQFYQALSQTNMKIIQKLTDIVAKAAKEYAEKHQISVVFNEDGCFFVSPELDISSHLVTILDAMFDAESKNDKSTL